MNVRRFAIECRLTGGTTDCKGSQCDGQQSGGFGFAAKDLERFHFAESGYQRGVPTGGDLKAAPAGKAPTFLIRALRDADCANLDRMQKVKGGLDASGKTQEKVDDVTGSGNRKPGTDCKLPAVGNTVNVKDASYRNAIGVPTPRWTTYDAKFFGVKLPTDVSANIQERTHTSPIRYTPT